MSPQNNDPPNPQAQDLTGCVIYQPGAIVSRVIVRQKAGNVTLFAFDAGQELSEHTAPFDALVQVLDGRAEVAVEGQTVLVAAGQYIILPANRPHAVRAPEQFKMMLTMIRG